MSPAVESPTNGADISPRGWLTVLSGTACLVAFAVWLFSTGTAELVAGLLGALAGLVLVVLSVIGAVVEHRPDVVLVSLAFFGVGAVLTATVFGLAYFGESLTYLRGEPATAKVVRCEDGGELDDDCEASWRLGGREYTGEIELSFAQQQGDTLPIHAEGDEAVRAGGLTVLVVASSGVAVLSPLLLLAGYVSVRRSRSA
ncbi:hypothetical protein [Actinophytocola xanthii]|uniref:Uncharacterized protein n=1 Tax=Actinophytocola xanthii TaxID=1912961 RepID=A0A1Q8CLY4_9PSEU|nr:hypothetical protein [Actinophytocola xanthii]OLF15369.1 hypothetical protein BU204_22260 [Actinophytocola xanthii]